MCKKLNHKNILAIMFLVSIILGGALTLASSPVRIFGGIVRGYINVPAEKSIFEKVSGAIQEFDKRVNVYFILHDESIHTYGGLQKMFNRSLINDVDKSSEVLKLNNGYLTFKSNGNTDLTGLSEYLIKLKETCDSVGSELVYVNKISKATTDESLLPAYYPYIYGSNFEKIQPILEQNNIATVNLGQAIDDENKDKYSLFFKTDHHWTPEAGVWVSEKICNELNAQYSWGLNIDLYDIDQFSIEVHSDVFLGSEGKRVGALYTGIDDFSVVKPLYETNLTVEMQDINLIRSGSFENTMLFEENITPDNLMNQDTTAYMTYMHHV